MKVSIIGTGSFGTSLSVVIDDNNNDTLLYGRNQEVVDEINNEHTNSQYLKEVVLPSNIRATTSLEDALVHAELIVLAVPVNAMRPVCRELNRLNQTHKKKLILVHIAKGLELNTNMFVSDVIVEEIDAAYIDSLSVLSGPSHAEEVALRQPSTVVLASKYQTDLRKIQDVFMNRYFRVYTSDDIIGVEIGGALKNIIALSIGLLHGLGFGDNTKAATITRGLQEITRLGTKMGADPLTFLGLTGIGDLIVTATSMHSRNYRCGIMLSSGMSLEEAQAEMGMVVEGVNTTKAAHALSQKYNVEMPITNVLYHYLFHGISQEEAFTKLMMRDKTGETEELREILNEQVER